MMELQSEIKGYLNDPKDYYAGVMLLGRFTKNRILHRNLSRIENNYNRQKLLHELAKAVQGELVAPKQTIPSVKAIITREAGNPEQEVAVLSPASPPADTQDVGRAVAQLEIAYAKMHNKKGMLSNSLRDFPVDDHAGRKAVLAEIDALTSSMSSIRSKISYYEKHGQLPPLPSDTSPRIQEKEIPHDPLLVAKMLNNERSNRSKLKGRLETLQGKDAHQRPDLEARLMSKERLIAEIERRLNGGGG